MSAGVHGAKFGNIAFSLITDPQASLIYRFAMLLNLSEASLNNVIIGKLGKLKDIRELNNFEAGEIISALKKLRMKRTKR